MCEWLFIYINMCYKLAFRAASINLKQFPSLKSESMQFSKHTCLVPLPSQPFSIKWLSIQFVKKKKKKTLFKTYGYYNRS